MKIEADKNQADIELLADYLKERNNILLLSHVNPDGDALGSMIALGEGLKSLGKTVRLFNKTGAPSLYAFLPGVAEVTDSLVFADDYEAVILIDCHSLERAGIRAAEADMISVLGILDHHEPGEPAPATVSIIDSSISAAGELVYRLLAAMDVNMTPSMATCLYVAISTDTGSFNYDNTTASSLEIASELVRLGAKPWDIYRRLKFSVPPERLRLLSRVLANMEYYYEGRVGVLTISPDMLASAGISEVDSEDFIGYPRSVKGVELALLITGNSHYLCHVSLRSRGMVNAAALAKTFGGGGHHNAAGFSLAGSVDEVKNRVLAAVSSFLPPEGGQRQI